MVKVPDLEGCKHIATIHPTDSGAFISINVPNDGILFIYKRVERKPMPEIMVGDCLRCNKFYIAVTERLAYDAEGYHTEIEVLKYMEAIKGIYRNGQCIWRREP